MISAARDLFAERGPDNVSLREVAKTAGVNHGLIHVYIGTRDDLLDRVFEQAFAESEAVLADTHDLAEAIAALRTMPDDGWTRLLAWTILSGHPRRPSNFGAGTIERIAKGTPGLRPEQVRQALAATIIQAVGLHLFGDWVREAVGLHKQTPEKFRTRMNGLLDQALEA
nr:TetR/AcrR family transcriptional regulator [Kineosporia babensis]